MKKGLFGLKRAAIVAVALAATFMMSVPAAIQDVSALQLTSRSIQLSNSTPGATGVAATITFTPGTSGTVDGIVVDFCGNSPIMGDSGGCATITGFSTNGVSVTSTSGFTGGGTWAVTTNSSAPYHTLMFTNSTGDTVSTSTPVVIVVSGLTNPSTGNLPFYARLATYAATTGATNYTSATPGSYIDNGGDALSTANTIAITATVMETLSFCTSLTAPSTGCTSTSTPNVTVGTGTPAVLNDTTPSTGTAYTQISSNDQSGTQVSMTDTNVGGSNCYGGIASGSAATNCIPGIGSTLTAFTAGTADFGLNVANSSGGTGSVTPTANYGPTASEYGMNTSTSAGGVASTYGSEIESSISVTANVNNLLTFAAEAAATTPAGSYQASMDLIATGHF